MKSVQTDAKWNVSLPHKMCKRVILEVWGVRPVEGEYIMTVIGKIANIRMCLFTN